MCVPNLVPIGPQTATCICLEGYTHRHTHTLSYIDIDHPSHCPTIFSDAFLSSSSLATSIMNSLLPTVYVVLQSSYNMAIRHQPPFLYFLCDFACFTDCIIITPAYTRTNAAFLFDVLHLCNRRSSSEGQGQSSELTQFIQFRKRQQSVWNPFLLIERVLFYSLL